MVPWEGGWAPPLGVEPRLEQEIWLWSGATTHWRNNAPSGLGMSNKAAFLFIYLESCIQELQSVNYSRATNCANQRCFDTHVRSNVHISDRFAV